jgi:hypothetical protein
MPSPPAQSRDHSCRPPVQNSEFTVEICRNTISGRRRLRFGIERAQPSKFATVPHRCLESPAWLRIDAAKTDAAPFPVANVLRMGADPEIGPPIVGAILVAVIDLPICWWSFAGHIEDCKAVRHDRTE